FENTTGPNLPSPTTPTPWTLGTGISGNQWTVFDNGVGLGQRWEIKNQVATPPLVKSGLNAAYINRENIGIGNTSEDYLATPLVSIPPNPVLRFSSRTFSLGNNGTIYQIKLCPGTLNPSIPANYTTLLAEYTENQLSSTFNIYEEKFLSLPSSLVGTQVYIAFVRKHTQNTASLEGDRWLLDDVNIESASCDTPTTLTVTGILSNSASLSWVNPSGSTSWEIEIVPIADTPTGTGIIYSGPLPYIATGLTPETAYKYYVRAICSSGIVTDWAGPQNFTTTFAPPVCGGNFVDNGGATSNYFNNSNNTVTICPTIAGEVVTVTFTSFDVETNNDALYVFNGSSITDLQIASPNGAGNVPGGLAGGYWGTTIPGPFTSSSPSGCLTFRFRSNNSVTNSGWSSNVSCGPSDSICYPTSQPVVSNITSTSATISWNDYYNTSTSWDILVLPYDAPVPTSLTTGWITASTNPFVITDLAPNCYKVYVRSICNFTENQTSNWSTPASICDCTQFGTCSDYITAIAFIDSNGNGIKDATENNFYHGTFSKTVNDGTPTYYSSNNGDLHIPSIIPTNSYDLNFLIPTYLNSYYSCSTSYNNITIVTGSGANYYYFPVTEITPYIDVSTYLYASNPRPGFSRGCGLYYRNNSTSTIASGTVTFTKNNLETITSINQSGTVSTATGFTYNFTNLAPNETRSIGIDLQTPTIPTVNLGDLLTISSSISGVSGDINATNNNYSLTKAVIGSYDPNEIYESRGPEIVHSNFTTNDYLYYTITFENTGTANAEFIRIENLLDSKLNPNSIEMVGSSHDYDLKRENNQLTWYFYNIDLPPTSLNPIESHGFVTYRIKPNSGYAIGDVIPNTANIYFDYNPAIVTNTFNTEFVAALGNSTFDSGNFVLVPNPASDFVHIYLQNNSESIKSILIHDVLGKTIKMIDEVNSNQTQINTSELSQGVY
uniref:T9SS-dependent choice-of-anchor J family protein n=1 Tax=Flavobacterium sp. TaxID=239 RepID=UPI00261053D7